jgi:hypothetical protein
MMKLFKNHVKLFREKPYYRKAFPENVGTSTTSTSGGRNNTVDFDLNEIPQDIYPD